MKVFSESVPDARVSRCYFEQVLQPRLAAMRLEWPEHDIARKDRSWNLPKGVTFDGPAPATFGIQLIRFGADCYALHLVWNQVHVAWNTLTRNQVEDSCLGTILAALGTDLQYLLNQPVFSPASENCSL